MPRFFGSRSSYKQFEQKNSTSVVTSQKNTAAISQAAPLRSADVIKSPPLSSIFASRKTAPQRQQEFIKAINVLYGSEKRARNSPIHMK